MNRNLIITIIVVALVGLTTGYYFINQKKVNETPSQTATDSGIPSPSSVMEKASLKSFMTMSGTQKCDFSDQDMGSSGVVYIDSGKVRGDFNANVSGETTVTHMINDGKNAYIWMDDQETGFKTTLEAVEQMSGQTGVSQSVDINKQVDYKCESWNPDSSKFTVPSERKFTDMSKMMENAAKMMEKSSPNTSLTPEENAAACSACNSVTGDSKTQCLKALNCK